MRRLPGHWRIIYGAPKAARQYYETSRPVLSRFFSSECWIYGLADLSVEISQTRGKDFLGFYGLLTCFDWRKSKWGFNTFLRIFSEKWIEQIHGNICVHCISRMKFYNFVFKNIDKQCVRKRDGLFMNFFGIIYLKSKITKIFLCFTKNSDIV